MTQNTNNFSDAAGRYALSLFEISNEENILAEVEQNTECGIYVEEFDEWKEGDIISAFELVEKKKNR